MKNLCNYILAAVAALAAGTTARSHNHLHHHAKRNVGSKVEKRQPDVVTEYVVGPIQTVYQLGGEQLDANKAEKGLAGGDYVIVGETIPSHTPLSSPSHPPPPPKPSSASASSNVAAQFMEKFSSSLSSPLPKPTSQSSPLKSTEDTLHEPAKIGSNSSGSAASTGSVGLEADFPSGKIKCSQFPSEYGALALDWLDFGGWSGLQFVQQYTVSTSSISEITTGVAGQSCSPGCMCSYACPPGYQKTQWPQAQGSKKESIGGIYCNSDGYLELTRESSSTLCEPGAGGVSVRNDLNEIVSTCRTDYPGTENMVIPTIAKPGQDTVLTNPVQDNYYVWDGKPTSAQYYVNKKGLGAKDACVWMNPAASQEAGNWSPMIVGVGKASDGNTYLSIFENRPTSQAKLDFNIEITGDVESECSYIDGKWTGGSDGCTATVKPGGKAMIRYF